MQDEVDRIYQTFVGHVASGRNISAAEVDSMGQGRVWSGIDAKRLGLVDVLGGINTALEIAAKKAGLSQYRTIALPEADDMLKKLMEDFSDDVRADEGRKTFGPAYDYYGQVRSLLRQQGVMARMPFDISVH